MTYSIFFDESGKLDREKTYSYYGAFGCSDETAEKLVTGIKMIYKHFNKKSEFHFTEYKNDKNIVTAIAVLHFFTSLEIPINIFIVNNATALELANKRALSTSELRKLFYVKIPERLFYGLTRETAFTHEDVRVTLDHSPEYGKMRVYSKIKEQMNAHSLYRHRSYQVHDVISMDSHKSIELQMIDMFLGIVVYLIERSYLGNSKKDIVKSDLIYKYLDLNNNLENFRELITIYRWESTSANVEKLPMSDYISSFIKHKTNYDVQMLQQIMKAQIKNPKSDVKELRNICGFSSNMAQLFISYLKQLEGIDENEQFRKAYSDIFTSLQNGDAVHKD